MPLQTRDIVVIGASAGGVPALQSVVAALPADFPAAVFVVMHLWAGMESYLPSILNRAGPNRVRGAVDDMTVEAGTIYVAPSDHHLMLEAGKMVVLRGPRENRFRPAIDALFRSAAAAYRNRVIGVILTGMLDDGAAGLWAVKRCGGLAVVQSDATFSQMPDAAMQNVEVDHHVPLREIAPLLARLVREEIAPETTASVPELINIGNASTRVEEVGFSIDTCGKRSLLTCPECHGPLWEVQQGSALHFRCHVGHAYSSDVLRGEQASAIEQSLWSAFRALKESAALDDRLAARSREHDLNEAAARHEENAAEKKQQLVELQTFLRKARPAG